jgi:murein DD-endopeptidase MepM/ murein hydrolase activator NlpD
MKRLAAVAIAALALSGSAGADVFKVVPSVAPSAPVTVPSAELPNTPGSINFPPALLQRPAFVETRTYDQLFTLWQRDGTLYGVPWQVLAAINKVESNFGLNMGPSSAGAIGWMQFMPSTWERWGVDADGDGIANPWNPEDAIAAAARYLAASGGASDIARAVLSYNHAQWYVDEVLQLAQSFGTGGLDATFNADPLQASFAQNTQEVADARQQLGRAERTLRALSAHERVLQRRTSAASLLSDRLALDQRAVRFGVRVDAARTRVAGLQAELTKAREQLAFAHDRALAASFAQASLGSTAAPAYNGQYVFPVGGGPSLVSVSHHHHDYPAADIAAPEGSPIYALADATVVDAWSTPSGRCGIGMTIDTADGQEWTYCHMSYLEPSVTPGAQLPVGTQVGLVGMTGHATGPHLHLQLDPTTSYPQLQPWFQSFAGVAFRWQDAGPTDSIGTAGHAPVFAVVPTTQTEDSSGAVVLFTR